MTNETASPYPAERTSHLLTQMRHGMNVMRLAVEASEGVSISPEMLTFLDMWIESIDEMKDSAAGAELSA